MLQVVRVVRAGPFRPAGAGQRDQQAAEPAAAAAAEAGTEGGDGSAAVRQDEVNGQPQEGGIAGGGQSSLSGRDKRAPRLHKSLANSILYITVWQ